MTRCARYFPAWIFFVLTMPLTPPPALAGACAPAAACSLVLRGADGPSASGSCTDESWKQHLSFGPADRFADSNGDGWWETVLELDLNPARGCNCALLRLHFADEPRGFLIHVGDSATNDGFGGDAGTDPVHNAELQLRGREASSRLSVFSATLSRGASDRLLDLVMPALDGRQLELEICDQFLSFAMDGDRESPGAGLIRSLAGGELFSITAPGPDALPERVSAADSLIYLGLNRVIRNRDGRPVRERTGAGLERLELTLTP